MMNQETLGSNPSEAVNPARCCRDIRSILWHIENESLCMHLFPCEKWKLRVAGLGDTRGDAVAAVQSVGRLVFSVRCVVESKMDSANACD